LRTFSCFGRPRANVRTDQTEEVEEQRSPYEEKQKRRARKTLNIMKPWVT
jgi:hypothetical protein